MGLEGISVNQLRITPEINSAELNAQNNVASNEIKIVDGLSNGQRVDPDKENGHNNAQSYDFENNSKNNDADDESFEDNLEKYDLSDTNRYAIKIDSHENAIQIIEKKSNTVIQVINADELSRLVSFLGDSCGSIVNRKF